MDASPAGERRAGMTAGLACYLIWGFVPLYFQMLGRMQIGAWEVLAHRIVWGAVAAGVFVLFARQGRQVMRVMREPRTLALLALSSALIAVNWVVFIWAVNSGRMLETSLGYYINPLVNMAAGALVFRERINRIGAIAIGLAAVGVLVQVIALGKLPWVSLALAFSFGGYGVVRKWVKADAQTGLFLECLLLGAPCLAYIVWVQAAGLGHFDDAPWGPLWLVVSGPVTAVPLVLFAWAARRVPLSAMGFMQFIAPTISFIFGIIQGEPFTSAHALSFAFIWLAAATFVFGAVRASRQIRA